MPHPQTRWPWAQQTIGAKARHAALTRAIRANLNRARHTRDPEERDYHLTWARRLIKERERL